MAELGFRYGVMGSRKSLELIDRADGFDEQGVPVITVKPAQETRGGDNIFSRTGRERPADILTTPDTNLRERVQHIMAEKALEAVHHILVDESQLLTPLQVDQLHRLTREPGIPVTAYGLRTDFQTQLFDGSRRLLEVADTIENIPLECRCGEKAEFNCRLVDGNFTFEGELIIIDGQDGITYEPLCGDCYFAERDKFDKITTAEA